MWSVKTGGLSWQWSLKTDFTVSQNMITVSVVSSIVYVDVVVKIPTLFLQSETIFTDTIMIMYVTGNLFTVGPCCCGYYYKTLILVTCTSMSHRMLERTQKYPKHH